MVRDLRESKSEKLVADGTRLQRAQDCILGIAIPMLLFVFDPIVFRETSSLRGGIGDNYALLGNEKAGFYAAAGVGMLVLGYWLLTLRPQPLIAGMLYFGYFTSGLLGVRLLPVSLVGAFFFGGIGVLGLIPFAVAWTYRRNAKAAWRKCRETRAAGGLVGAGFLAPLVGCVALQVLVDSELEKSLGEIRRGPSTYDVGLDRLSRIAPLVDLDRVVKQFRAAFPNHMMSLPIPMEEGSPEHRLARAYRSLTGDDIQKRAAKFDPS